jgi:hypothetical protein
MRYLVCGTLVALLACCSSVEAGETPLPAADAVLIDRAGQQIIVPAVVVHPEGKPCIDDWGQRVQAFAGCRRAAGGAAKFADYFVFLSEVSTEEVYEALLDLGARPRVHYSTPEAKTRTGLTKETRAEDYLQGDPIQLSVFWADGERWIERPYQDFAQEKVLVEGGEVIKPWTPHYVFHGSGAIHASGTGCIACPCDCAGGIIADNRYPVFNPKPIVRFDWTKAPPVGTPVYVRIRPSLTRE